eukprot:TRINITY_DN16744_c0_g1_i3.p1 TRINITY_DN16744_c0_g1~~TRINITY_DN16744_c0_g1_i3.p1  ORF type:complete len:491 (+),score=108.04 TRINITY_DN16744_c0_g1_i3:121-1473(+)
MATYMWLAAMLCYIDRTNMSVAMIPAAEQHGWTKAEQGVIFSAFFIGYGCTQVLGGLLAGRFGGPIIVTVAVVMWSLFTLLTPEAANWGFASLILARIGLGLGEGLAIPAAHAVAAQWYPAQYQAVCVSFVNSGHQLGTVIAMALAPAVAADWELVFHVLGVLGFVWAGVFCSCPPPEAFTPPDLAEQAQPSPWRQLLLRKPCWAIYISHFSTNVGFYILITWLPAYFHQHLGVPLQDMAKFTVPAYLAGAVSMVVVGHTSDQLLAHGWDKLMLRRAAMGVAMVGCSVCLLICVYLPADLATPHVIAGVMCVALACHGCHHSGNFTNMLDIAPDHAGLIQGVSNTIATTAGVLGNLYVGTMLPSIGWSGVFLSAVCVYLSGFALYMAWSDVEKVTPGIEARKGDVEQLLPESPVGNWPVSPTSCNNNAGMVMRRDAPTPDTTGHGHTRPG